MPVYKATFHFVSGKTGWSESYYTSQGTPASAMVAARDLAKKRMPLCGVGIDLEHIRVSDLAIRGDAVFDGLPGYTTIKSPFRGLTYIQEADATQRADVSWTAAIVSYAKDNVVVGRTFMRGLPDTYFENDRTFVPEPVWQTAFKRFAAEIFASTSAWGFNRPPRATPSNTFPISLPTFGVQGVNSFTAPAQFVANLGDLVRLNGIKTTAGRFSGTVKLTSAANGLYTWHQVFKNLTPPEIGSDGNVRLATPTFVTGLAAQWNREATSRKAGRPFGELVGRRTQVRQLV